MHSDENKQELTLSAARGRALTVLSSSLVLRGAWSHMKLYSIYTTHTKYKNLFKKDCCGVVWLRQVRKTYMVIGTVVVVVRFPHTGVQKVLFEGRRHAIYKSECGCKPQQKGGRVEWLQPCRSREETRSCQRWDYAGWNRVRKVWEPRRIWRVTVKDRSLRCVDGCGISTLHCSGTLQQKASVILEMSALGENAASDTWFLSGTNGIGDEVHHGDSQRIFADVLDIKAESLHFHRRDCECISGGILEVDLAEDLWKENVMMVG